MTEARGPSRSRGDRAPIDAVLRVASAGLAGFWLLWWTPFGPSWLVSTVTEDAGLSELWRLAVLALVSLGLSFGAWLRMVTRPPQPARWCAVLAVAEVAALAISWLSDCWREDFGLNGHRWPLEPQGWPVVAVALVGIGVAGWALGSLMRRGPSEGRGPIRMRRHDS